MLKFSIITATFNSGGTIRDTIESVLAQSYPNYEHIIVMVPPMTVLLRLSKVMSLVMAAG